MESYINNLPDALINLIVLELDYNSLYNLLQSNMVDEKLLDYKDLFYQLDNEMNGRWMTLTSLRLEEREGKLREIKYPGFKYEGYKDIIRDTYLIKTELNPYKILYFIQLKRDRYLSYLSCMKRLYTLDNALYQMIIPNKTYTRFKYFEYLDKIIKIFTIDISDLVNNITSINLYNNDRTRCVYINNLIYIAEIDSIKEIAEYVENIYKLGIDATYSYEIMNRIKYSNNEKYVIEYIRYLLGTYQEQFPLYSYIYDIWAKLKIR